MASRTLQPVRCVSRLIAARRFSNFLWNNDEAAKLYFRSRPPYEPLVVPWLMEYYFSINSDIHSPRHRIPLAVDVGCGSGQLTVELAKYCDRVIGVDQAEDQIAVGQTFARCRNVEYRVGRAETFGEDFQAGEVDLIASGTAAHFFDTDEFLGEVRKCLKPNGVVGLVGYFGHGYAHENKEFQTAFDDFLAMQLEAKPGFEETSEKLKSKYRSFDFPFSNVKHKEQTLDVRWTFAQIDAFMSNAKHLFRYPEKKVPFPGDPQDPSTKATVRLHVFGVLGHN